MRNITLFNSTVNNVTTPTNYYSCSLLDEAFQWRTNYLTTEIHGSSVGAAIISSFLCPLTTLANAFVITAFLKTKTSRRSRSNMMLSSLSITDLIIGLVVHPFFVIGRVSEATGVEKWVCYGRYTYKTVGILCVGASMGHLMFISIERALAFKFPTKHRNILSRRRTFAVITFIWLYSACFSIGVSSLVRPLPRREMVARACYIVVCISVMVCCYGWIHWKLNSEVKSIKGGKEKGQIATILKEAKLAKTMAYTCIAFFMFFLPEAISNSMVGSGKYRSNTMIYLILNWTQILTFSNSLFNPIWYSFVIPVIRRVALSYLRGLQYWLSDNSDRRIQIPSVKCPQNLKRPTPRQNAVMRWALKARKCPQECSYSKIRTEIHLLCMNFSYPARDVYILQKFPPAYIGRFSPAII